MNAVVDDLTNYLGPDPNAIGRRRLHEGLPGHGRPDLDAHADDADGHDVRVLAAESARATVRTSRPATSASTSLGIPGTNDQGIGSIQRGTPAIPQFNTGFSAVGNRDGWNPIFRDERTYSLATNITKVKGRHDIRGGYLMNFFYLDHWQPETGNPRGEFDFNGAATALNGGAQTNNFYNQYASFLLGLRRQRQQERAERADDRARVAARAVRPRPVDAERRS